MKQTTATYSTVQQPCSYPALPYSALDALEWGWSSSSSTDSHLETAHSLTTTSKVSSGRGDARRLFKGENDKVSTAQTLAPFLTTV